MKITLKSSYPCLVKVKDESFDIDENDLIEIEDENEVFVYPLLYNRHNFPFVIKLNNLKNTERYSVFEMGDKTLIFLKKQEEIQTYLKEKLEFQVEKCEIKIGNNYISFETEKTLVKYFLKKNILNFHTFKIENFACVELDGEVFAFNVNSSTLFSFKGNEIEFEKNLLKIKSNLDDSQNRKKSSIYEFSGDNVKTISKNFEYKNQANEKNLIPYQFLEALKAKDYVFAKNLLGGKLEKIDEEKLADFLGNFQNFYPLTLNDFIVEKSGELDVLSFILVGNRIDDISFNKLKT